MKAGIHPDYVETTVTCSCGNTFQTRSTKPELHVELCNECHPFFTGRQKLVDTGGRVERFQRRYGKKSFTATEGEEGPAGERPQPAPQVDQEPEAEVGSDSEEAAEPIDA